jgi:hypothetical protein
MKIIKIIVIILVLFLLGLAGGWYFVTDKIATELNEKYAGKEFAINGVDKTEYFITFNKVVPSGFPYKIAWKVIGWKEESRNAEIIYKSPLEFGYDLRLQQAFISYNGDIVASYKPAKLGFGSLLSIDKYNIAVDIPLNTELLKTLKAMKDPVEIVNHVSEIKISTGKVEIFDLIDNEKFYDKEFERIKLSFVSSKTYENIKDLFDHLPQEYKIQYVVKTKPNKAVIRRLPVSLFYGFSALPAGFDFTANAEIKTKGNNIKEFMKGLEVKADIICESSYVDLPDLKIHYKSGNYSDGRDFMLDTSSKVKIKSGMFDHIFEEYGLYAPLLIKSPLGGVVDQEIRYIIQNKEVFNFKDLENSSYEFGLKMNSSNTKNKKYLKIEDFSILSDKSGVRLKHEMQVGISPRMDWFAKGVLYLTNYPAVIEFSSGYIYRFGKFKMLNDEARHLYVDVNKAFLKDISDHPQSTSSDLSFEYKINSNRLDQSIIGSIKFDQIITLYTLMLYQKLFDKVGHGGDVLSRMREILPQIDGNEPLLQKILPRISGGNIVKESVGKKTDKATPAKEKDIIRKIGPKDKSGLHKNLLK